MKNQNKIERIPAIDARSKTMRTFFNIIFVVGLAFICSCSSNSDTEELKFNIDLFVLLSRADAGNFLPCSCTASCNSETGVCTAVIAFDVYKNGGFVLQSDFAVMSESCGEPDPENNFQPGKYYNYEFNDNFLGLEEMFVSNICDASYTTRLSGIAGHDYRSWTYYGNDLIDGDLQNFTRIIAGEYSFVPVR